MGVKMTKDNVSVVLRSIQQLASNEVLIGIPASTTERQDGEPINNATIGYIQETGSPVNNLPARPFLVPGVESAQKAATDELKKGASDAMDGNAQAADKALHRAGIVASNAVKAKINSGIAPELAHSTLAARRRRGRTGTTPLIDTGSLRNAITYVLRKK
ncbi:hypothetical protein [Dyella japonica]|uniref:Bacteriophage protein n=1 Tax=Dyella japonica TaxID=231455 RepID=A0ABV2JZ16_9GAMM